IKYAGTSAELKALADGLSEEIVTGLSRFSYLRVIARSSTTRYANESADVRSAGKELGARYVMEGTLRQAGTKLRLGVEQDPRQADAWAMLAIMYDTEFADEYNPRPNPLERAMAAAQRAVDLAPTHAL